MKKRIVSFALTLAFILAPIQAIPVLATPQGSPNSRFLVAIDTPAYGSVPISNRAELAAIANDLNGKYHLVADLDLSDGAWVPIGTVGATLGKNEFGGTFDGQGHVIRNLTVKGEYGFAGLFGAATSGAVIKNVGLEGTSIAITASINSGRIPTNLEQRSSLITFSTNYGHSVGGVVGYGGNVINCYNTGSISVTIAEDLLLTDKAFAGGISGVGGTVSNCYNTGSVSIVNKSNLRSSTAASYAGGICGFLETNNYWGEGSVTNCFNTGDIAASTEQSKSQFAMPIANAGGIVGCSNSGVVTNTYNTGTVNAAAQGRQESNRSSYVGGITGYSTDNASTKSSFWNSDSTQILNEDVLSGDDKKGLGYGIGQASPLTSAQMQSQVSFTGWDFGSIWDIIPGENNGYPVLRVFSEAGQQKGPEELPFDNPHNEWAEEELKRAFEEDLFPPLLRDPTVDLREPITRVEFAGVAVLAFENLSGTRVQLASSNPFADTGDIYARMAFEAGLMVGVSANSFAPDTPLNREQAATALTRVFKRWHFPGWSFATDADFKLDYTRSAPFSDDASISDWAWDSVYFMAANGIIQGVGENTFAPRAVTTDQQARGYATATREQALLIALRMVEKMR